MPPPLITLLLSLLLTTPTLAQTTSPKTILVTRLYSEIAASLDVQSQYIGCFGHQSALYQKVDSLKMLVGIDTFIGYFDDVSVNLKYYAFIELLAKDDRLAFEKLQGLSQNKDSINFLFAGWFYEEVTLTELLTAEYLSFIHAKYAVGGSYVYNGRAYSFGNADKHVWRQEKKRTYAFIKENGLSRKWIENF